MKKALLFMVGATLLFFAPALLGCEDCLAPGTTDPVGNPVDYYTCWNTSSGPYSACVSGTATRECDTWTDESCDGGGDGGLEPRQPRSVIMEPVVAESDRPGLQPQNEAARDCVVDVAGRCLVVDSRIISN